MKKWLGRAGCASPDACNNWARGYFAFKVLLLALLFSSAAVGQGMTEQYTVRRGDTFLEIALKYGLTQEQLQSANPTSDPNRILPGTRMIIPPSDPAAYEAFLQSSFSEYLLIENVRCFSQVGIRSQCLAEIINPGTAVVYNINLRLTVLDGSGSRSESDTTPALIQLLPGERLPVLFSFPFTLPEVNLPDARVINLQTSAETAFNLRLTDAENRGEVQILPGGQNAAGTIDLKNMKPFSGCQILAAAYNAAGEPVGIRALAAGEGAQSVDFNLYALEDSIASVKIWIETY